MTPRQRSRNNPGVPFRVQSEGTSSRRLFPPPSARTHGAAQVSPPRRPDEFLILRHADLSGAADLVGKLQSLPNDSSHDMSTSFGSFEAGNVLFHSDEMLMASWAYRDLPFDFGVVPVPTYSEDDEFSTCASFTYTLYGIPLDARDPDMSSAVMEAMAYEGWKTVTPRCSRLP